MKHVAPVLQHLPEWILVKLRTWEMPMSEMKPLESKPLSQSGTSAASPLAPMVQTRNSLAPSIIGTDLNIVGNVVSNGEIQVEGEIHGDIHCASLIVGEKATINGGIVSDDVVVRGKVIGSIRGSRVTVQASGQVEGDIYHSSLAIEMGATFDGRSARVENPHDMSKGKAKSGDSQSAVQGKTEASTTPAS